MYQKIVAINFTRMGDILQSGPLLRKIVRENRGCELTLIVQKDFVEIAEGLPMVDRVIAFDTDKIMRALNDNSKNLPDILSLFQDILSNKDLQNVDLLVNLSHTPLSATLCHLINAKCCIGLYRNVNGQLEVSNQWANYLFTLMKQRNSNPFNLVEIFLKFCNGSNHNSELEYELTDEDKRQARNLLRSNGVDLKKEYIVLQLGASTENRRWPINRFARLSEMLVNSGYQVIIVGTKSESSLAEHLLNQTSKQIISLVGKTSVRTLAGVLSTAEKLVSNDTGTIHLAAALKTSTIGIYLGPASAKDTAPFANDHLVLEADIDCAPCSYQNKTCLYHCRNTISEHDIFQLIISTEKDLLNYAKKINGARVYLTSVTESGEFSLVRLNSPKTSYDERQLNRSRYFWNHLLGEEPLRAKNSKYDFREDCEYEQLTELQQINSRLTSIYTSILNELKSQKISTQKLNESVLERNDIFSRLSELADGQNICASFAQFMMVRNSMVPICSLETFLLYFEEDVTLLNHAITLFGKTARINDFIEKNKFAEA